MEMAERIKSLSEQAYPIYYQPVPGHPKDCRVNIARKEGLRSLCQAKLWAAVSQLIKDNQGADTGIITSKVNQYLGEYLEKHHHQ